MLCFHRSLVRFTAPRRPEASTRTGQQTLNHKICFLHVPVGTHNEHDRQHVAPLQGRPESLGTRGGLRTSFNQLHVFGEVQMRKLRQLYPFTAAIHLPSFWILTQRDS